MGFWCLGIQKPQKVIEKLNICFEIIEKLIEKLILLYRESKKDKSRKHVFFYGPIYIRIPIEIPPQKKRFIFGALKVLIFLCVCQQLQKKYWFSYVFFNFYYF